MGGRTLVRPCDVIPPSTHSSPIHPHAHTLIPAQLAGLGAALYKLHTMGLLPTHAADYAAFLAPAAPAEFAGGGAVVLGS